MNGILTAVPTTIPAFSGGSPLLTVTGGPGSQLIQNAGSGSTTVPYTPSGVANSGLAGLAGVFVDLVVVVLVLALLGGFVIVVVANRADPDPSGRRPQSVYFFAVSFVTILTSILGSTVVVAGLTRLIGSHPSPVANTVARTVVLGGLITLIAVVLLVTHLQRGLFLARSDPASTTSPSRRVGQSYVSAVAFLMVLVLLVTTVLTVYLVFSIVGPGVFGSFGGRAPAVRYLVITVYLAAVAATVLWTHRSLVPPGLHVWGGSGGAGGFRGGQPGPWAPPGAPTPPMPAAPPAAPPPPAPAPPPSAPYGPPPQAGPPAAPLWGPPVGPPVAPPGSPPA